MSIDRINISNQGIDRAEVTQGLDQARNAGRDRAGAKDDSINLSSRAVEFDRVAGKVEQSRSEQLERVRQALESGTYHVSGKDIARKLIEANKK
jgi:anti-sigma28 factor (negative regulator of flagellin synthesis)